MRNHTRRPASPADKMFNAIVVIIIAVVLGLGVYAVYGRLSANLENKAIESGQAEQTVKYAANQAGMSVDEYLDQYGLKDSPDVNEKTTLSEMTNHMTVESFAKYNGQELDAFLDEYGLKDKVSADTMWPDAEKLIPTGTYVGGNDQFDAMKEAYELDDSITAETPWGEAKDKIEEAAKAYQEKMANATPAPTAEATEEAASEATEAPAADAEESPAAEDAQSTETPAE